MNTIYSYHPLINRSLSKLNLAYNEIKDISGFKDLSGPDYQISHIDLRSNLIGDLSHAINCVGDLSHLKVLLFQQGPNESDNPICSQNGYKEKIFQGLQTLRVLDGLDRNGALAADDDDIDVPGTNCVVYTHTVHI